MLVSDTGVAVCETVLLGVLELVNDTVAVLVCEAVAPREMVAVPVAVGDVGGTQEVRVSRPVALL